jgi:LDH2 family malate/lactate/ureidoglycolate dehydrogenase
MSSGTLVQAEQLENFVQALFVHAGMAPEPARDVAKALLWAELRGIDTHGVGRVGFYLNFIQKGVINTQAAGKFCTTPPRCRCLMPTPAQVLWPCSMR